MEKLSLSPAKKPSAAIAAKTTTTYRRRKSNRLAVKTSFSKYKNIAADLVLLDADGNDVVLVDGKSAHKRKRDQVEDEEKEQISNDTIFGAKQRNKEELVLSSLRQKGMNPRSNVLNVAKSFAEKQNVMSKKPAAKQPTEKNKVTRTQRKQNVVSEKSFAKQPIEGQEVVVTEQGNPVKKQKSTCAPLKPKKGISKPKTSQEKCKKKIVTVQDADDGITKPFEMRSIRLRTTPRQFANAMSSLTPAQKECVRSLGFGSIIGFDIHEIPGRLCYYVVDNFDPDNMVIKTKKGDIKVDHEAVHDVFGIPMGGVDIFSLKYRGLDHPFVSEWLGQFPDYPSKPIHARAIGEKITTSTKTDMLLKMNFLMLFANTMAACGRNGGAQFTVLNHVCNDVPIESLDWCGFVLECLKYSKTCWSRTNMQSFYAGPATLLTLLYLDRTKFDIVPVIRQRPAFRNWSRMLKTRETKECELGRFGVLPLRPPFNEEEHKDEGFVDVDDDKNFDLVGEEASENVFGVEGDLDIENDVVGSDDDELNRDNTQNMAEELCTPHIELGVEGLYNIYDGWVLSFGQPKEPMTKELGQTIPRKASTSQCSIICVQGYEVKENAAPILEAIFKKHGDIAAKCVFTIASVRASLLEVVCEVVRRIQTNDVIEKMEEIESHVSQAEAAKIDVSWLRVHLEAIYKRKDVMKKWTSLMETKVNTVLVQRAARMDLNERCAELVTAQERFEEAERCVRVLHLVEKKLNNNILESKAEKDSLGRQPMLQAN